MKSQLVRQVLLLEDEEGDAHLLKVAFSKAGFAIEIEHVKNGLEALQVLNSDKVKPSLILLDLKMPGMDGLEFLSVLKNDERLRAIPAVVISTSVTDFDINNAYRHGAAGYVFKTPDVNDFILAISRLGEYWFKLVRLPESHL